MLLALWQEPLWGRAGTGEKIRVGHRFMYRCDRCRRELECRWRERNVLPVALRGPTA